MPRDGQGNYSPPLNNWNPAVDGNEADPAGWNQFMGDVSAALSQSVSSDGQTMLTGNLKMGGNTLQGMGQPAGNGQALRRDQLLKGPNIASASTIAIPVEGAVFEVTGTTTITQLSGAFDGRLVVLTFQGELTIRHGPNLRLPNALDITTKTGDGFVFYRKSSSVWACLYGASAITEFGTAAHADVGAEPDEVPTNELLSAGAFTSLNDMQWLGTPVGNYIAPRLAPPTDDPRFRYILCTAGESGPGGYNEDVLINETITGTDPLINAYAVVSLDGSPYDGITIDLINTERRFVGAGESRAIEDDMIQNIVGALETAIVGSATTWREDSALYVTSQTNNRSLGTGNGVSFGSHTRFNASRSVRAGSHTQPRAIRIPHYMRIL